MGNDQVPELEIHAKGRDPSSKIPAETMDLEGEIPPPDYPWDDWARWVDQQVDLLWQENQGVHERIECNTATVENFMEIVQSRVDGALQTYENAICTEFARSQVDAQNMRENLMQELQKTALEIRENARNEAFQFLHNNALEQGLLKITTENVIRMVKGQMEIEKKALEESILQKVGQTLKPELQNTVDSQVQTMKTWISANLSGFAQRIDEIAQKTVNVENLLNSQMQKFTEFREKVSMHAQATNFGVTNCVRGFQKLSNTLANVPSGLGINSMREELSKVVRDFASGATENANREGRMHEIVQTLERRVEGVQQQVVTSLNREPKVVVVPPAIVQVPVPPPAAPPATFPAPNATSVQQIPKVEILKLVPLNVEEGGNTLNLLTIQEALLECAGGMVRTEGGTTVEIRPVEVRAPQDNLSMLNLPVAAHLSRSQPPPKFSNKKEDWSSFVRKFDSWVRTLASGKKLSENEHLQLLNSCLPESLQKEIQLWELERGRLPTYVEFRAYLEAKFGRAQSENMRKKWLQVEMPKNSGKLTAQQFDEFRVNFRLALVDVPDATQDEARRILGEKIPPFMRKWVIEAEAKKMKSYPIVELLLKDGMATESVSQTVAQWVGRPPIKVETKKEGMYLIHFDDEKYARKLSELHGRSIEGLPRNLQARAVEQYLSLEEMFEEIAYRMEMQEKTADFQKRNFSQDYNVRKATAESIGKMKPDKQQNSLTPPQPEKKSGNPLGGKGVVGVPNIPAASSHPQNYQETVVRPQPTYQGPPPVQYQWEDTWHNTEYAKGGYGGKGKYGGKGAKGSQEWNGGRGRRGEGLNNSQKGGKGDNFAYKGGKGNIGGKGGSPMPMSPSPGTQQAQ